MQKKLEKEKKLDCQGFRQKDPSLLLSCRHVDSRYTYLYKVLMTLKGIYLSSDYLCPVHDRLGRRAERSELVCPG